MFYRELLTSITKIKGSKKVIIHQYLPRDHSSIDNKSLP